jgi:Protein of unknown function (DUF3570)
VKQPLVIAAHRLAVSLAAASLTAASLALLGSAHAGVLPDDRADYLQHSYQGGGINIQGPSVLVRKKFGDHVSAAYNYYSDKITGHVDTISGASVDAVSGASTYKEERKQNSLSVDVLLGKVTYSAGFIDSNEPDYKARTAFASVSEDMFGDLTTVTFGVVRGWDKVGERGAPTFSQSADHRNWQLGLSQILTRNLLLDLNFENTESEGYLNNPYRRVRYLDALEARGYGTQQEQYPHTRTGNAGSLQLKYHLPGRGALDGSYRYYSDTWGIRAHTALLGVTQPLYQNWLLDGHLRYYRQNHANFYSDLYPFADAQNFMARDRELATFKSMTLGAGVAWQFHAPAWSHIQKASLNARLDRLRINYDDYLDLQVTGVAPGTEPLYTLDATVLQFFISAWF